MGIVDMIYAVNERTKEHRVIPELTARYLTNDDRVVRADADGWIEWNGGECPLPDYHIYDAKCDMGNTIREARFHSPQTNSAWSHYWGEQEGCYKIIAYRPILNQQEPTMTTTAHEDQPEWRGPQDGLPPVGTVCEVIFCEEWRKCEVIAHFRQSARMVAAFTVEHKRGNKNLDAFRAECFRPIPTPRQRWVGEAIKHGGLRARDGAKEVYGNIYDALKNGDLPMPDVE